MDKEEKAEFRKLYRATLSLIQNNHIGDLVAKRLDEYDVDMCKLCDIIFGDKSDASKY